MLENNRRILMSFLVGAGLLFAVLAGLAERIPWLHTICAGFGDGCRETTTYVLFGVPLWIYGVAFYVAFGVVVWAGRLRPLNDWLMASLLGVEATLVVLMATERLLCVYCLGNLVVVLGIFAFTFSREAFWKTISLSLIAFLASFHLVVKPDAGKAVAQPQPKSVETPAVAAKVGDRVIGTAELEAFLITQIYDHQREIYRLKREKLDDMIVEALLQNEAATRNITVQQLVTDEVISREPPVSEAEIDQYLVENRAKLGEWKGSLEELRNRIRTTLQQQKSFQKVLEYAKRLETKYPVTDYLEEPVSPFAGVKAGGSPAMGPENARVTVFEFSDYECPSCRQTHEVVKRVRDHFGSQIRWVFKDYPLKRHEHARAAAEAARCAADQGKFWQYQDLLYGSKEDLKSERLLRLGADLGLDIDQLKACMESGKHKPSVERDLEEAKKAGLDRTPSFLINGRLITGSHAFDRFVQIIDEELKNPPKKP